MKYTKEMIESSLRLRREVGSALASCQRKSWSETLGALQQVAGITEKQKVLLIPDADEFLKEIDAGLFRKLAMVALGEATPGEVAIEDLMVHVEALAVLLGLIEPVPEPEAPEEPVSPVPTVDEGGDPQPEPGTLVEAEFGESVLGSVANLQEADDGTFVTLHIEAIQPGWGNTEDNNYYPKRVLERDAPKLVGAKMFETNHVPEETNNRTWVSTVTAHKGFSEAGAPTYGVSVHDPTFIAKVKNLQAAGLLNRLECSIRAKGMVRPGKVGDREGKIVESISEVYSIDWVDKGGAGGRAVGISEEAGVGKNPNLQESAIKYLGEGKIEEILEAASLPKVVFDTLKRRKYLDVQAVKDAVLHEREYLSEATGAGLPFAQSAPVAQSTVPLEEVIQRQEAWARKNSKRSRK